MIDSILVTMKIEKEDYRTDVIPLGTVELLAIFLRAVTKALRTWEG